MREREREREREGVDCGSKEAEHKNIHKRDKGKFDIELKRQIEWKEYEKPLMGIEAIHPVVEETQRPEEKKNHGKKSSYNKRG